MEVKKMDILKTMFIKGIQEMQEGKFNHPMEDALIYAQINHLWDFNFHLDNKAGIP